MLPFNQHGPPGFDVDDPRIRAPAHMMQPFPAFMVPPTGPPSMTSHEVRLAPPTGPPSMTSHEARFQPPASPPPTTSQPPNSFRRFSANEDGGADNASLFKSMPPSNLSRRNSSSTFSNMNFHRHVVHGESSNPLNNNNGLRPSASASNITDLVRKSNLNPASAPFQPSGQISDAQGGTNQAKDPNNNTKLPDFEPTFTQQHSHTPAVSLNPLKSQLDGGVGTRVTWLDKYKKPFRHCWLLHCLLKRDCPSGTPENVLESNMNREPSIWEIVIWRETDLKYYLKNVVGYKFSLVRGRQGHDPRYGQHVEQLAHKKNGLFSHKIVLHRDDQVDAFWKDMIFRMTEPVENEAFSQIWGIEFDASSANEISIQILQKTRTPHELFNVFHDWFTEHCATGLGNRTPYPH